MREITNKVIESVKSSEVSFCRFITANDTGETGSHQSGYYIPKNAYKIFFTDPGERGSNKEKFIKIKWQKEFETTSRAIYYGQKTRNEYRLTQFGHGFPFLSEDFTGSLLIITKLNDEYYEGFVLSDEEDIEDFLDSFGMSPTDTNNLFDLNGLIRDSSYEDLIGKLVNQYNDFPDTKELAVEARNISEKINNVNTELIRNNPDESLIFWLTTEYDVFKKVEEKYYLDKIKSFDNIDDFSDIAHSFINRRMARAGSSLENQLDAIFKFYDLLFDHPGKTEKGKKPDFIFPSNSEYHLDGVSEKLIFLGAKTTCKDRWRQILIEANKIPKKHLFTLQQGISLNQLREIYDNNVTLVVPQRYINSYPQEFRENIMNLKEFLSYASEKQN